MLLHRGGDPALVCPVELIPQPVWWRLLSGGGSGYRAGAGDSERADSERAQKRPSGESAAPLVGRVRRRGDVCGHDCLPPISTVVVSCDRGSPSASTAVANSLTWAGVRSS